MVLQIIDFIHLRLLQCMNGADSGFDGRMNRDVSMPSIGNVARKSQFSRHI